MVAARDANLDKTDMNQQFLEEYEDWKILHISKFCDEILGSKNQPRCLSKCTCLAKILNVEKLYLYPTKN